MEIKKNRVIRIVVIGAGLIGRERIKAIDVLKKRGKMVELIGIFDPYSDKIDTLCKEHGAYPFKDIQQVIDSSPDWVILAVPHDEIVLIAVPIINASIHILLEKPLGRNLNEAKQILSHTKFDTQLAVGFNYRFFEGIRTLLNDAKNGMFGNIVSLNIFLGHGGDPNMKNGWKLDPIRAGGGCLLDPGIHLLDLSLLLFKNTPHVIKTIAWNGFWNTGIEEECIVLLKSDNSLINLQVSVVHWKSIFRMEINGTDGYGMVTGRGRSYGIQTYVRGKRWGWLSGKSQSESEELVLKTNGEEVFADELDALFFGQSKYGVTPCNSKDGLKIMELYDNCIKNLKHVKMKLK